MNELKNRESFSSSFAIFFATLGSAVGLGNIWKFPYITGENGGGAFVLIYILCILLLGIPIMLAEFYIGRNTNKNAVGAFKQLKPRSSWSLVGILGLIAAFFIMIYYSSVAGWVFCYIIKAIQGDFSILSNMSIDEASKVVSTQFQDLVNSPYQTMAWQVTVMALVAVILILGVKKGIERITKLLLPVLFVLLILCAVKSLTLPNAFLGVRFLFEPDFSEVTTSAILTALGLAFFKLSIGSGTMITYSSYFTKDCNLLGTAVRVSLSDTLVSMLAGIAIFPAVFSFGLAPADGPGLLFKTIPLVFSKIPFGGFLIFTFFVLCAIASVTAMISLVQVTVAFFSEELKLGKIASVLIPTGTIALLGVLTVHHKSIFGNVKIMGKNFFDIFDIISSNILLPIGGLLVAIFVGYFIKKSDFLKEVTNENQIKNTKAIEKFWFIIRYVAPILLIIVFLNQFGVFNFIK